MATKQPDDKSYFILPDLGEGVHEAELIKWRVKPGEAVQEHQVLAEMETDKALVEVPSPWAGVVTELNGKEGEILKVGSVLVRYQGGGKAASTAEPKKAASGTAAAPKQAAAAKAEAAPGTPAEKDAGTVVGSVDSALKVPDRFMRRAAHAATTTISKALATPAVRRIAREMGVDINVVQGTGRGGRVTATDVQSQAAGGDSNGSRGAAASRGRSNAAETMPQVAVSADGVSERIPFRGVRRKIAQALSHSVRTTVHFTVVDEADVTALDRKRKEYAAVLGQRLSMLPFIINAVCMALRKHPALNAIVDDAAEEILRKGVINLGIAVDTEHGLMVPVMHDADKLSIVQAGAKVGELADACRNRTVAREQLMGGTFTISNVGSYGGMFATPIINYPEVAILAAGRAKERVLVKNGQFYAGVVLPLSLSCDHRVVDGAEGARFLNTVVKLLEDPAALLRT